MTVGPEALGPGHFDDRLAQVALDPGGQGDVSYLPAGDAQQMVVVLGEILRQLETGEVVMGHYPAHHPGGLEVDEVAVSGAAGQIGEATGDLGDTDGVTRRSEQGDDGAPSRRVTLVRPAQPRFY